MFFCELQSYLIYLLLLYIKAHFNIKNYGKYRATEYIL